MPQCLNLFKFSAHAERQAFNTTVQGSAADLTKTAMIAVEKRIFEAFPQSIQAVGKAFSLEIPRLVLHLHDELMYEVCKHFMLSFSFIFFDTFFSFSFSFLIICVPLFQVPQEFVDQFCQILKHGMESAIPLAIKLPVKVKVGESWGNLRLKQFVN